ncbi:ABC transporter substrate-binding protein [Acidovorax sp.]|uniref:ABC transporter substrate-binding protein n=1 Tax=Acidovorax sp. TaxID=1872122 RepID=UPI002ACE27D7|nr:ABC transporter substrate-binding protein [Acidovorax sp.]MDZ7863245.1 ABC transporter substrate-binding protein [Acidovorax sp.]
MLCAAGLLAPVLHARPWPGPSSWARPRPSAGPSPNTGRSTRKGADACMAAINAAGGVRRRPVAISYLDDGYEPARAVANARTLAGKGISAFVNLVGASSRRRCGPYAK